MKTPTPHFYLFKGNWFDLFDELVEMLQPGLEQNFAIWEPQDKSRLHSLIVVYGAPLSEAYCFLKGIWKTNEKVFDHFYLANLERFIIHGTKENDQTIPPFRGVA